MKRTHAAGTIAAATVGVMAVTAPAGATNMSQFNWGSNPNVASPANADVVGFWQEILWAASNVYTCHGQPFKVDGIFGPITKTNTKSFQSTLGVTQDGIVGTNTWNHAMNYVPPPPHTGPALTSDGHGGYSYYTGQAWAAVLYYGSSSGGWKFQDPAGFTWHNTSYTQNTIGSNYDSTQCAP